jgi:hypothetical protein
MLTIQQGLDIAFRNMEMSGSNNVDFVRQRVGRAALQKSAARGGEGAGPDPHLQTSS